MSDERMDALGSKSSDGLGGQVFGGAPGVMVSLEHYQNLINQRDRYKEGLEEIIESANGLLSCTVEYLEMIAEDALSTDA